MKLNLTGVLIILSALCSSLNAFADPAIFIWSDSQGFVPAPNCELLSQSDDFSGPLAELAASVLEIRSTPVAAVTSPFPVQGSFWQAASERGLYLFLRCGSHAEVQDYLPFDVHLPEFLDPVARVGVRPEEIQILSDVRSYTPREAEDAIRRAHSTLQPSSLTAGISAIEGSMEHVVCVTSSRLNVRDESLSRVLFSVARHETVKPVQSWETNKKTKVIDGETYTFVKVQFPQRPSDSNIGWVAEMYVTPKSKCPGVPSDGDGPVQPSGWTFPTIARPTHSYRTGMRRFQASRGGGTRWHAASDLYRVKNESAVAVSAGQVLRGLYFFYQGTYAIEVRHTGGKVVRYGEITGRAASGVSEGRNVSRGQVVGYIGQVNSNCCLPMLHFEMYSGTASGPLTQGGNKFQRRRDLLDPTGDLMKWEKEKFGVSH